MSYLRDYLFFTSENEAPDMFHVWCGYGALSAAVGRRVWLVRGDKVVYPNIYVLLVGSAGCGKTEALGHARKLLARLENVPTSMSIETPEGICRFMGGNPKADPPIESPCSLHLPWPDGHVRVTHNMTICANEFIDFISKNPEGWTSMLNNIYDEDKYDYRTKNQGEDVLIGPYVVLLGAIPTDVQKKLQQTDIINTGFGRRTFMQYGERKYSTPFADQKFTDVHRAAQQRCLDRLRHIQSFRGPLTRTPEAGEWWKAWYDEHSKTLLQRATPATQGWLSSKPNQVVKLAILTSLSERDDLTLRPEDYQLGLEYINQMELGFPMIFGGVGRNELGPLAMKLLETMTNSPAPLTIKQMTTRFFAYFTAGKGSAELHECLNYLVNTGRIASATVHVRGTPMSETYYSIPEVIAKLIADAGPSAPPSGATPSGTP